MGFDEAKQKAIDQFSEGAALILGCESTVLDSTMTETHDWGWVFHFKPREHVDDEPTKGCAVAYDRDEDHLVYVGKLGAEFSIRRSRKLRNRESIKNWPITQSDEPD